MNEPEPRRAVQLPRLGGYLRSTHLQVRSTGSADAPFAGLFTEHPKYPRARWRRCWAGWAHLPGDRWWVPMLRCRREAGHPHPHYARRWKAREEAWW